ncbi:hypothetical protein Tco_1351143, partial [Tanacetum coccineum]
TPITEPTSEPSSPSPAPDHETMEHPFEQPSPEHKPSLPRQESEIPQTQAPTYTHKAETWHIKVGEESQEDGKGCQEQTSGEIDISPQGLEAAETLAEVLSQLKTKRRNVKTGVRRRLDAKDVSTGFEGFEEVSTGFTDIKSASEKVSSGGEHVSASQREGKAILEETPQTKRTKKQIREEQASLAEIARIQAEEEAENARREGLKRQDELVAKRLQEELELSEAQKKIMAQVQEAAQFYTEEDWGTIWAKLEANADLVKEIAGEDVSEADYAQRMVGLINQRRKLMAKQKAKAQRDKPMTQAQQRQYMATYLKNQGGWKLAQIKKLTDEELKVKFEYLIRSMERFVPMDTEKESKKRTEAFGRKGLQRKPESTKSGTEEDVEATWEEELDEHIQKSSNEFNSTRDQHLQKISPNGRIIKNGMRGLISLQRRINTVGGICELSRAYCMI